MSGQPRKIHPSQLSLESFLKAKPNKPYVAFDIEIAKIVPDSADDLNEFRPLGISCAATLASGDEPVLWHGKTTEHTIADQMNSHEVKSLVNYLEQMERQGYTILTWNGLGFDFDILAEESGSLESCRAMAIGHLDMMFHLFCIKGFPLSLAKAAAGMGLAGKHMGMSGAAMPQMWAEGRRKEVLDYVAQDVRMTLALAEEVEKRRALRWTSNQGRPAEAPIPKWLLVKEALGLPEPDTSWMRDAWSRKKFVGWTGLD